MWSSPRTFADGEVERARYLNQSLRDNLRELVGYYAEILTGESTTNTGYVDLATVGPLVSCVVGGTQFTAIWGCQVFPTAAAVCEGEMSLEVQAAGSVITSPSDNFAAAFQGSTQNRVLPVTYMDNIPNSITGGTIVAGSPVTVTAKYRAINANGATFQRRFLYVIPVGP